jgi:ATP-dependent DNA helicase RecQ
VTDLERLAKDTFGIPGLYPRQREVIDHLVEGRSAAAIFPTGGGKSLCYQLPALVLDGVTLVVSPLIALMKDQIDALRARGVLAHRLDSSLTSAEYREVMDDVRGGRARMLYVAPERFQNERFRGVLSSLHVSLFAVDEAHCISEWGHNFRPDYLKLAGAARACGAERVLALTATATPKVAEDVARGFDIEPRCVVRAPFYRENLELQLTPTETKERDSLLLQRLRDRPRGPSLVYVSLQKTAERVASDLAREGYPARAYHAGMKPEARAEVQDEFLTSKDAIVVATIAFGMGVDKPDIRYVTHYNLPKSLENLAQEIGRAGRDGAPSICETLVCPDDLTPLENFAYGDTPTPDSIATLLDALFHNDDDGDERSERPPVAELELDLYNLGKRCDVRPLVLRTLLTYLELDGYLEGGTPLYAVYRFKPVRSAKEILELVDGERRDFLRGVFRASKKKRVWVTLDVDQASVETGSDRGRIVRALDWLSEQGHIDLEPSKVRHRYYVRRRPDDAAELAATLGARMATREAKEIERLEKVLELAASDRCQVRALGAYFGDDDDAPCGHCSVCARGAVSVPARRTRPVVPAIVDDGVALASEHRGALGHPRQLARFLCGLTSPKLTADKLTRHPRFGALSDSGYAEVLAAVEAAS